MGRIFRPELLIGPILYTARIEPLSLGRAEAVHIERIGVADVGVAVGHDNDRVESTTSVMIHS